jgi:hypothetical protein
MMTSRKSFKSRVRTRMDKTGESYTTARRHLLARAEPAEPAEPADPAAPPAPAAGTIRERFSDASVRQRTGRGWDEWFALLDDWRASTRGHTEITRWLATAHQVPGWWTQSIAVAYEQARGMRAPGQTSGGDFSAGASRTVAVPVRHLFEAFVDESLRRRWLPGVTLRIRTATAPRTLRADWTDGTRIAVGFTAKGDARAQVAVAHEKLTDARRAAEMKAYWRERLTVLRQLLER